MIGTFQDVLETKHDESPGGLKPTGIQVNKSRIAYKAEGSLIAIRQNIAKYCVRFDAQPGETGIY